MTRLYVCGCSALFSNASKPFGVKTPSAGGGGGSEDALFKEKRQIKMAAS